MQDPKNRQKFTILGTIAQFCRAVSLQLRHVSAVGKILLNSSVSPTCPHNMVNFGPLAAEICWQVSGTYQLSASAKVCGIEQRVPLTFGKVAITSGICPLSSCECYYVFQFMCTFF